LLASLRLFALSSRTMVSIPYIMPKKMIGVEGVAGVFQYGKGKSKKPVSSDDQEKENGTSASGTTATEYKSSDSDCDADQETVRALTAAFSELQRDFRDKCQECQVLKETVTMISDDFIQSARNLIQANLRIEQLEFKMQAVTFWDSKDSDFDTPASPTSVVDLAIDAQGYYSQRVESDPHKTSPSKRSDSRGQRQRYAQIVASSYHDDDSDEDSSDSSSRGTRSSLKQQNAKSMSQEQNTSQEKKSQDTDDDSDSDSNSPPEEAPITPRQAAFVRVMWERDLAQTQARQLTQILLQKREECFYLSEKLSKTTTLVELAYQDDDDQDQDTGRGLKGRPGSSHGYDLSWLTDDSTDSTDSSTGIDDDDDPELSAIEMQLDIYCSVDTDRAAGLAVE
jgi:hypothetical protein